MLLLRFSFKASVSSSKVCVLVSRLKSCEHETQADCGDAPAKSFTYGEEHGVNDLHLSYTHIYAGSNRLWLSRKPNSVSAGCFGLGIT